MPYSQQLLFFIGQEGLDKMRVAHIPYALDVVDKVITESIGIGERKSIRRVERHGSDSLSGWRLVVRIDKDRVLR